MDEAFEAVDEFLMAGYGIGLEDVLCDGCYIRRLPPTVVSAVTLDAVPTGRQIDEGDRGMALDYRGTLTVEGLAYRFRCSVFVDRGGERFLSNVTEFAPVDAAKGVPSHRLTRT